MGQTEIQWLVQIMMEHKLPGAVREKFIARIGEVEKQLSEVRPTTVVVPTATPLIQPPPIQSTRMPPPDMDLSAPPPQAAIPQPPIAKLDKETGRPMVATGRGTFGPRKF